MILFNVFTGEETECKGPRQHGWLYKVKNTDKKSWDYKEWYPCHDWCGRYVGSVFGDVFHDIDTINKMKWG